MAIIFNKLSSHLIPRLMLSTARLFFLEGEERVTSSRVGHAEALLEECRCLSEREAKLYTPTFIPRLIYSLTHSPVAFEKLTLQNLVTAEI